MSNLFFDYIVIVCLLYQCFVGIIVVNGIKEKDVKWLKFSISSQAFRYQQERLESIPHLGCQRKRYWSLVFFDVWADRVQVGRLRQKSSNLLAHVCGIVIVV